MWNFVVIKILFKLYNKDIKVVAYAEDVVLLIKGKLVSKLSKLMESVLRTLLKWPKENGLGVKKTEPILFTRKYKISDFSLPHLESIIMELLYGGRL